MTEARVERVPADRVTAREYLGQARRFLEDASQAAFNESSQILFHHAAIAACDAIPLARGLRVSSGDRAHGLRLKRALDAARAMRVEASYRAFPVPSASLGDAAEATRELCARAEELVG